MATTLRYVGTPTKRIDAPDKLKGVELFAADVRLPGMAHARLVASPHASARIAALDGDSEVQTYVELEAGGKEAFARMIRGDRYAPYTWRVRHFREHDAHETWIRVQPEGPGVAHAACVAAGFEPAVHFDARTEEVALELVAAGLGVAFVSSLPGATEWPGVVLRDLGARAPVRRAVTIARSEPSRSAIFGVMASGSGVGSDSPCATSGSGWSGMATPSPPSTDLADP